MFPNRIIYFWRRITSKRSSHLSSKLKPRNKLIWLKVSTGRPGVLQSSWRAAIHEVSKSQTWLSDWTELNTSIQWNYLKMYKDNNTEKKLANEKHEGPSIYSAMN